MKIALLLSLLLTACGSASATWRAADVDAVLTCRFQKQPGSDVPILACRSFDVPSPAVR